MRYAIFILILAANGAFVFPVFAGNPDWSGYERILSQYVNADVRDGIAFNWVDYQALRTDPSFGKILHTLDSYPLAELKTREDTLGFYINAYNILAIKMVIDHWPLDSIKDAGSWFKPVWDRPAGRLGGRVFSLGQIEHDILRPMREPRIHFALVCASVSCPDLRREAYRPERLSEQLDDQTRRFLSDPRRGLRLENGSIRVSKIFGWFRKDFEDAGGVETFLRRYVTFPDNRRLAADLPYDWRLNDQRHAMETPLGANQ